HVTDTGRFKPFATYVALIAEARRQAPRRFRWRPPPYEFERRKLPIDLLCGGPAIRRAVERGASLPAVERTWRAGPALPARPPPSLRILPPRRPEGMVCGRRMSGRRSPDVPGAAPRLLEDTQAGGLTLYRRNFEGPERLAAMLARLEGALGRRLLVATDH